MKENYLFYVIVSLLIVNIIVTMYYGKKQGKNKDVDEYKEGR